MKITGVKLDTYTPKKRGVCAEATVELDNQVAIHKIRVINGDKGLFIAMPNCGDFFIGKNGKKHIIDIVHPLNRDFQEELDETILDMYNKRSSN